MEQTKRIIVVGGVAAGMSFATRYKRLRPYDEVLVFDKGPYVSFANCGLPYAISDTISSRARLIVETKERLGARFEIDVFTETEVLKVDEFKKEVLVTNKGNERTFRYDSLVLAPGARPVLLNIKGLKNEDVYVLRNIPDLDRLMAKINDEGVKNVIVIGAGFIGLEVAENLKMRGLNVVIVEKAPHVLPTLDHEMAAFAHEELTAKEVSFFVNDEVKEVNDQVATLKSGTKLPFDLIVMSVGVEPDTTFLNTTTIKKGGRGHLLVDEHYMTSVENIYAVGDAILLQHQVSGELVPIALANPANKQGRQLADHLGGLKTRNRGGLGSAILKLFDLTFASTGLNERQLKNNHITYQRTYHQWFDHATYYPGATTLYLKILFNMETGEVYGAQVLGKKGVDKRIDVIMTAIKAKLPIQDFPELEFAYAPPFSLAKDIVNLAGYHASNVMLGITNLVEWDELQTRMDNGAVLVDVRSPRERAKHGYIKDSINIPIEMFRDEYDTLPLDKEIILYCESGTRSYNAERILKANGYKAYNLNGSFAFYRRALKENVIHD